MSKIITISIPDEEYESLESAAQKAHQSPEDLIVAAIAERFVATNKRASETSTPEQQAKDAALALMRARGHLVDPQALPPYPGVAELPMDGSSERAQLEDELGEALSDALERSGLTILDLIERR